MSSLQDLLGAEASISTLFAGGGALGNPVSGAWYTQLRSASFGGVPFGVLGGQVRVGRRNAVHEYPFKDQVWVEDLGRSARRISLFGFLVENAAYGGGPVIAQRERMIAVCESPDQKTLVHPTLGALKVSLLDASMDEAWDKGRVFMLSFTFIEAGDRVFPSAAIDTGGVVGSAADALDSAAGADFGLSVGSALDEGSSVVDMAVATASTWSANAVTLASDATNLMHSVGSLQGPYSRYFGGRTRGFGDLIGSPLPASTTVSQLIASGTAARTAVGSAASSLANAAGAIAS